MYAHSFHCCAASIFCFVNGVSLTGNNSSLEVQLDSLYVAEIRIGPLRLTTSKVAYVDCECHDAALRCSANDGCMDRIRFYYSVPTGSDLRTCGITPFQLTNNSASIQVVN